MLAFTTRQYVAGLPKDGRWKTPTLGRMIPDGGQERRQRPAMRNFIKIASGVEVLPLLLDLYRQPELWNSNTARTGGKGSFEGTDDIWVRFRAREDLTTPEAYREPFIPVFYPAWHALPHLRPIVFGLMSRCEAVQLGGILITRVPGGQQVKPHDDRGRWHPEFFTTKAYLPLATNPACYSTCEDERVVMRAGDCWIFDNLKNHATVNNGETDRITVIVSMRAE